MILDKYNMTKEQNIFLAKRNIVDSIYSNARIEGINITFPETQNLYSGINVARLTVAEIDTIRNLKRATGYKQDLEIEMPKLNTKNIKKKFNVIETIYTGLD